MRAETVEKVVRQSFIYGYAVTQPFAFYIDAQPIIQDKLLAESSLIQYGENSEIVRHLQYKLSKLGHYEDAIDGVFGLLTESAVKGFQSSYQLTVTGQVDEKTMRTLIHAEKRHEINQIKHIMVNLNEFSPPEEVMKVQQVLFYYGYYQGSIDGIYGPLTENAIEQTIKEGLLETEQLNDEQNVDSDDSSTNVATTETTISKEEATVVQLEVKNDVKPLIETAKSYIGTPYTWGGTSPEGFDCSGFIQFVYAEQNVVIPRTVNEIWNFSAPVESPAIGDLVFFETYQPGPSHLGIYLGDGNFIHAGTKSGVTISNFHNETYWQERYIGAKRIYQ